jgi:predicted nucleic acid-binding Zn ribbon protein
VRHTKALKEIKMLQYSCKKCEVRKEVIQDDNKSFSIEDLQSEQEPLILCDKCGEKMFKDFDGISFAFPIYDISYNKNFRRFKEGMYHDDSAKQKRKTTELNEEMRYNSRNKK